MASKIIKGLTVEIGGDTTKLGKALEGVEKQSRSLSSELGSINRLLKLDPTNTELLAQKQKVLADAISSTEERLDTLKEAEKQVQAQFEKGEASEEQVRALKREIIDAESKLDKYKNAARETAEEIDRLGDESGDAAEEIEDLGESAEEAEEATEDLGESAGGTLADGLKVAAGLATAAAAAIIGIVESTQEYRTAMGKLKTAFETSNHSAEEAEDTYRELQSVLGDTDQAVEASSHLAKLAGNEEDLAKWTDALTGVYATFGASLPIEGLAEAANETAKNGQVTGALADALNWAAEEGETFGVTLKENIDFTELSAKELDALTDAQKAEYKARKKQYDTIEDYNKRVKEATKAEDKFNIALENCTSEQERQELILKTLTKKYKSASDQYKKTNKDVIEANKANEEWNATMAELGAEMQPAITEIKKMGTTLLKDAKEPLKDVANFITQKFLPSLLDISNWVKNNGTLINSTIAGVTTAWVGYKAATIAATVAEKGLKDAIMATTVAQKAHDLVLKATPWGLAATAIGGVVTALAVYIASTVEAAEKITVLNEEERALLESAKETTKELREQRDATTEAADGIMSNTGYVQSLTRELQSLADASGKVQESDEARVKFILNELNEALGTEYELTDGVIQQYDELKNSIDQVILSKTASSLLELHNEDYLASIQAEGELLEALSVAEQAYLDQRALSEEKIKGYNEKIAYYQELLANATETTDRRKIDSWKGSLSSYRSLIDHEKSIIEEAKGEYEGAAYAYGENSEIINRYREAETAVLQNNYDRAIELLKGKGHVYNKYADEVSQATREAIDALYKEAIDAGIEAERTRRNFENGVEGYTEEMVNEAAAGYGAALEEWATAAADAQAIGEDLSGGLAGGMENKRLSLMAKARSIVNAIIGAMRNEADSHSPSRKMIALGEDMGEGGAIGLENKSDRMLDVAENQVDALLDTYTNAGANTGRGVINSLVHQNTTTGQQNGQTASNADVLHKILAAIERGQILTIDGKTWVGATAEMTDTALGQRRVLAARGAV